MRLASFNIKNGLSDDGSCDPDALVVACRRLRADVLALQEVDRDVPRSSRADQTAIVAAGCGLNGLYAPLYTYSFAIGLGATAIAFAFPPAIRGQGRNYLQAEPVQG